MDRYPNIYKACLSISLDNGGINRTRPLKKWREDFKSFMKNDCYGYRLEDIDKYLGKLSNEELEEVCNDPENTSIPIPNNVEAFLAFFFEKAC